MISYGPVALRWVHVKTEELYKLVLFHTGLSAVCIFLSIECMVVTVFIVLPILIGPVFFSSQFL